VNILEKINSESFRSHVKNNIIEYKNNNGIKTVDDRFTSDILSRDPLEMAEILLSSIGAEINKEVISSIGFINIHINRIIKEEISKLTHDVSFGSPFEKYINVFKMNNFEIIYKKEYNHQSEYDDNSILEKEVFLWNKEYSMLIQMDSYSLTGSNSINLYCQGVYKNKPYYNDICSNIIPYTNYRTINVDLRDLPSLKIQKVIENFNLLKEWRTIHSTDFYSYLSHVKDEDGEINWDKNFFKKLIDFPEDVKISLLSKLSSDFNSLVPNIEKMGYSKNYFNAIKAVEKISNDNFIDIAIKEKLLDLRFSSCVTEMINSNIYKVFKDHMVEDIADYGGLVLKKALELKINIEDYKQESMKIIDSMNLDLLNKVKDVLLREEKYKFEKECDSDLRIYCENLIKTKENKLKLQ
jgi:hypothetical protein